MFNNTDRALYLVIFYVFKKRKNRLWAKTSFMIQIKKQHYTHIKSSVPHVSYAFPYRLKLNIERYPLFISQNKENLIPRKY